MMTEYLFWGQLSFTTVCFCCELSEEVIVFFTHTTCLSFCVRNSKREIKQMFFFFSLHTSPPFSLFLSLGSWRELSLVEVLECERRNLQRKSVKPLNFVFHPFICSFSLFAPPLSISKTITPVCLCLFLELQGHH